MQGVRGKDWREKGAVDSQGALLVELLLVHLAQPLGGTDGRGA